MLVIGTMQKAVFAFLFSLSLCSCALAGFATDDAIATYLDDYSRALDEILDTCTVFNSSNEQDRCIAVQKAHWDKKWRDEHSIEFSRQQNVTVKQRLSEIDRDIRNQQAEINKAKKEDKVSEPPGLDDLSPQ